MNDKFKAPLSRAVYGTCHVELTRLFKNDQAFFRAPCKLCGNPHERKCDYVVGMKIVNGVRMTQACNMPLCRSCATTYAQVDRRNTLDYCPEHDKMMLEKLQESKL